MAFEKWDQVDGNLVGYEIVEMEATAGIFGVLGRLQYYGTKEARSAGELTNFQLFLSPDGARCLAEMLFAKADEAESAQQNPLNMA